MDIGLMIRWGQIIPGREDQALALFDEAVTYYLGLLETRKITAFEPCLFSMADLEEEQGFFLVKGPVADIFALMDSDEYQTFMTKANLLVHHLQACMLNVGDGVMHQIERYKQARTELHV
jgi:hypothetical protein